MAASKGIATVSTTTPAQAEHLAQVLHGKTEIQQDRLQLIQEQLLEQSLGVVQDAVRFAEVDKNTVVPPQAWVEELGQARAEQRLRLAQAAWCSAKEAPIGIKVAAQVAVGILKARATEKTAPKTLNVAFVNWSTPLPQFAEQDFERD